MKNNIVKIVLFGILFVLIGSIPLLVNAINTTKEVNLIELRKNATEKTVEWKYKGESEEHWHQLFTFKDVQGERGERGLIGLRGISGENAWNGRRGYDAYCTCN